MHIVGFRGKCPFVRILYGDLIPMVGIKNANSACGVPFYRKYKSVERKERKRSQKDLRRGGKAGYIIPSRDIGVYTTIVGLFCILQEN